MQGRITNENLNRCPFTKALDDDPVTTCERYSIVHELDIVLAEIRSTLGWGEAQEGSNGLK